jgi:hypothetical protein
MRLDIPQDLPRHRDEREASSPSESQAIPRKLPENPIHQHLKLREERAAGYCLKPAHEPRKRTRPMHEISRERTFSPDPRRPRRSTAKVIGVELRDEEKQLLREAGRFRVIRTADLREMLYSGKRRPLENDLHYLRDKGLVETTQVNLRRDGRRRTIERVEVVTLTRDGRRLLLREGDLPKDQKIYFGLVKPREIEHDSQIYRAYLKEAERIERKGGTNLRVKLDFEIKAEVQKAIYNARKVDSARDMLEIKEDVAEKFELPFISGKIQIPDARIEFDLPREPERDQASHQDQGTRTGHEDIEVLTAAYHRGHLHAKSQAGFRNYASSADRPSITAKIENDHHLMENILEL